MQLYKILILQLAFIILIGSGYIMNIVKLTRCDFEAPYKAEVVHAVGLFTPICVVTGWMDFGK